MTRVGTPWKYKPTKLSELPKPWKFRPMKITNHVRYHLTWLWNIALHEVYSGKCFKGFPPTLHSLMTSRRTINLFVTSSQDIMTFLLSALDQIHYAPVTSFTPLCDVTVNVLHIKSVIGILQNLVIHNWTKNQLPRKPFKIIRYFNLNTCFVHTTLQRNHVNLKVTLVT